MDTHHLRFIGRHIKKNNKDYFSYSGCGFEFAIISHKTRCVIKINLISELQEYDYQFIAIYINDVFHCKEKLTAGVNTKEIHISSVAKEHTIKIIKLNETYLSSIYLDDIVLFDAQFVLMEPSNKKLIGFYGDSITCGYGIMGKANQPFMMETEDFTKTYAYLACLALNMDYTVIARSGISVALKIWCDKEYHEIYDTVDMYEKGKDDRTVDYAVISLVTNDCTAYLNNVKEEDKPAALIIFKEEYIRLIDRIIKDNPNVKIVMAYNMLPIHPIFITALKETYEYAISHFQNPIHLVEFIPNDNGGACHPHYSEHKNNAKILVKAIKDFI